jgi:transposase
MLAEAAWTVARAPGTSLHAHHHRIARRRGKDKAAMALAHSMLVIAYSLLRDQQSYSDLGPTYLDQRDAARTERKHVHRLEQLGYSVALSPAA